MGVLADLVARSQPALVGRGCAAEVTEGATWLFTFIEVEDDNGDPINLDTGITGTCKVYTEIGGTEVAELTYTGFADGSFELSMDEDDTGSLAGGADKSGRKCVWSLTLDDGTDKVQVWGPSQSRFVIYPKVA